jgi:DNA modification methylase
LIYSWYCPNNGEILDPFAGGSVRGIVAGMLGLHYTGFDLRQEQVDANRAQAEKIKVNNPELIIPNWICADSKEMGAHLPADYSADLIFSCPPYLNLERYSDDKRDLSTMDDATFYMAYAEIIAKSLSKLSQNRFASFVISEVRDKDDGGAYRHLLNNTVYAFEDAGSKFYNEAVLVNSCGSLPIRIAKQFDTSRKVGRHHQNIYTFVKGDAKEAAKACGPVVSEMHTQKSIFDAVEVME